MNNHQVMVYGSLLRGFGNHYRLHKAVYKGRAVVRGTMYDLGPYPAVSLHGGNDIHGEVYECDDDTLASLDRLEGVPHFYQRSVVDTSFGPCYIYTMDRDQELSVHRVVQSGDWAQHRKQAESA